MESKHLPIDFGIQQGIKENWNEGFNKGSIS